MADGARKPAKQVCQPVRLLRVNITVTAPYGLGTLKVHVPGGHTLRMDKYVRVSAQSRILDCHVL